MFHNAIIGIPTILSALTLHEPKIRHTQKPQSETVLVMQGGGSLGLTNGGIQDPYYTCIKFDIVAGTSIGAINAGIVAGSRSDHPEKHLDAFWLDLAETITPTVLPDYTRAVMSSSYSVLTRMPSGIGTH
jgi:NTE family protein